MGKKQKKQIEMKVIPVEEQGNEILMQIMKHDNVSFMLKGKQREVITWHEFPSEIPPKCAWYMVSVSDRLDGEGPLCISSMYYTKDGYFDDYSFGITERTVVAWAFPPMSYARKEKQHE